MIVSEHNVLDKTSATMPRQTDRPTQAGALKAQMSTPAVGAQSDVINM